MLAERDLGDGGEGCWRHLASGFADDVDEVVVLELGGDSGQLGLDEDQAGGILDGLRAGISGQVITANQRLYPLDFIRRVLDFNEQRANVERVAYALIALPAQIASLTRLVVRARHFPPAKVMRASGEQPGLVSLGMQASDPLGSELTVHQSKRMS